MTFGPYIPTTDIPGVVFDQGLVPTHTVNGIWYDTEDELDPAAWHAANGLTFDTEDEGNVTLVEGQVLLWLQGMSLWKIVGGVPVLQGTLIKARDTVKNLAVTAMWPSRTLQVNDTLSSVFPIVFASRPLMAPPTSVPPQIRPYTP